MPAATDRPNRYPRSGPYRGLVRRVRAGDVQGAGRHLLAKRVGAFRGSAGTCVWCDEPAAPRCSWHDDCLRAYLAAAGATVYPGGRYTLLRSRAEIAAGNEASSRWVRANPGASWKDNPHDFRPECEECGGRAGGIEIDHRVALSVAHARRDVYGDPKWWRAWTIRNLRALCHGCHAVKTGADRRELAALRRELAAREHPQARLALGADEPASQLRVV